MRSRVVVALMGAFSVAAGCAYDPTLLDAGYTLGYEVPAVEVMVPQGPEFNQGLREGYLGLGGEMGGDYGDRWHFQFKAVDLAKGELVLPDTVESRWLAADRAEELSAARARLLAALDQTGRRKAPTPAAEAQVAFDCWLEQAVWDADGDLTCKQRFETAIAEVERALTTEGGTYLVFFAWDQADLTPVTQAVLAQVVADYARGRPTRVVVAGHADRLGHRGVQSGAVGAAGAERRPRARGARRAAERAGRAVVRREQAAHSDRGRRTRAAEPPRGDRVRRAPSA